MSLMTDENDPEAAITKARDAEAARRMAHIAWGRKDETIDEVWDRIKPKKRLKAYALFYAALMMNDGARR